MKSSRMMFAKKLKSIRAGEYLNQDRILQVLSAADGISEFLPKMSNPISQITNASIWRVPQKLDDQITSVTEVVENEKDGENISTNFVSDKENVRPPVNQILSVSCEKKESKPEVPCRSDTVIAGKSFGSGFRRPDLNSSTLFDPKLLEAFELVVVCFRRINDFSGEGRVENEDVIVFPDDVSEIAGHAGAAEEHSGNDRIDLPAIVSTINTQVVAGEETTEKYNNTPPGIDREEERARKDENALHDDCLPEAFISETVSNREARNEEECLRKDDNTLHRIDEVAEEAVVEKRPIGEDVDCLPGAAAEDDGGGKDKNTLPDPLLLRFEERYPPGGEDSVIFYTTTLRGIRKTFDDCNMIRFLLDSFKVRYYERDISMHRQYREELRRMSSVTETEVLPPVLFIKGRCIGGAQRVLGLHEQGKLRALFNGVPVDEEELCRKCNGIRFLMCDECRGSRRIVSGDGTRIECVMCNENGLIVCVDCSLTSK